jgi:S-adenosylmethionine:tRNA ribosyltransferase-isomerase
VKTSEFDYDLPQSYVAQRPVEPRDSSRLLVVDRKTGALTHRIFREIGEYLSPGDLLVANESRVIPARLFAHKVPSGGKVELLLLKRQDEQTWESLVKGRKTPVGTRLALSTAEDLAPVVEGKVVAWTESGGRLIRWDRPIDALLDELGIVPLPPYIHVPLADPERYQTVYARQRGSVAAPTAGLHFTPELLLSLRERGIELAFVNLDIGLDTFRPVETEQIEEHHIHTERCSLSPEVARQVNQAKLEGRRVFAVGTTSVRVLETAAQHAISQSIPSSTEGRDTRHATRNTQYRKASRAQPRDASSQSIPRAAEGRPSCPLQTVTSFAGSTDLYIYPGFHFRAVDALLTNFHLPRSSLLMLVSAFAGRELIMTAYEEAKRERYRFFSFGDAMLIL